jgi:hypothetical protein
MCFLYSCQEKEVVVTFPKHESRINVKAELINQETIVLYVGKTNRVDAADPQTYRLDHARAYLIENETVIDSFMLCDGVMNFPASISLSTFCSTKVFNPAIDSSYYLSVSADDYPTARSEPIAYRSSLAIQEDITVRYSVTGDSISVAMTFTDDPAYDDSYRVNWYTYRSTPPAHESRWVGNRFITAIPNDDNPTGLIPYFIRYTPIDYAYQHFDSAFRDSVDTAPEYMTVVVTRYGAEKDAYEDDTIFVPSNVVGGLFPGGEAIFSNIIDGYGYVTIGERDSLTFELQ